jgi:hypothetical protein
MLRFLALLFAMAAAASVPSAANAAIVCQRKARVTLRPGPRCKHGEQMVVDLSTLADRSRVDGLLAGRGSDLARPENEIGVACPRDAGRRLVPAGTGVVPGLRVDGCRTVSDPAVCAASFDTDGRTPFACFSYAGRCFACDTRLEALGVCVNTCQPLTCAAAPARRFTTYCENQNTQADCDASFVASWGSEFGDRGRPDVAALTCRWNGTSCILCGQGDARAGLCQACATSSTRCASRPGPPTSCLDASTKADCETRWSDFGPYGVSCYWTGSSCNLCLINREFLFGACHNDC